MELMKRLINEEEGQGLTEYGLVLAVVVVIVVASLSILKGGMSELFNDVKDKLDGATDTIS